MALAGFIGSALPHAAESADRLVAQGDFVYAGAFRLPPDGPDNERAFSYGGTALAYVPAHDSLLIVGHDWLQRVAEISIPDVQPSAESVRALPAARLLQPLTDILRGHRNEVGGGGAKVGGMLPIGDQVVVTAYVYYDATKSQSRSHFVTSLDFARSDLIRGPYTVGRPGFTAGYMTPIPAPWQADLGGPFLTGQCCLPIIDRTSFGPALSVFDPADLGAQKATTPVASVLGYQSDHTTLGGWNASNTLFNGATTMGGVVFPQGTRSVLFFGRMGTGPFCYGSGTRDAARVGQLGSDGARLCLDTDGNKGTHSYPYVHEVWAYDVLDLIAVRRGKKQPWDVKPYATWSFDLPFQQPARLLLGAAYDDVHHRLFVSAASEDDARPVIHVFRLRD